MTSIYSWMILISIIWFLYFIAHVFSRVMAKLENETDNPHIQVQILEVSRNIYGVEKRREKDKSEKMLRQELDEI